jgi:hypothetical protein
MLLAVGSFRAVAACRASVQQQATPCLHRFGSLDGGGRRPRRADGRAACGAAQTCGCRGEHMRARLRHGALSSSSGAVLGVLYIQSVFYSR